MDSEFWLTRWERGQIGFHEGRVNELLEAHVGVFAPSARVLVPLSGKAVDMSFLASRGHDVVGIEWAPAAAVQFFAEQGAEATRTQGREFVRYASHGIEIAVGDMFRATREEFGTYPALYDRGALVAVAPDTREAYVRVCLSLLEPAGVILLVTLEHESDPPSGPPWSITRGLVEELYGSACSIDVLATRDTTVRDTVLCKETLYKLTRRGAP